MSTESLVQHGSRLFGLECLDVRLVRSAVSLRSVVRKEIVRGARRHDEICHGGASRAEMNQVGSIVPVPIIRRAVMLGAKK